MAWFEKILIALFASPIIGFVFGWLILRHYPVDYAGKPNRSINDFFKRSQIVTGITLALSHGTNDAQKTMGIITLALVTAGYLKVFIVPHWVIFICATAIAPVRLLAGGA